MTIQVNRRKFMAAAVKRLFPTPCEVWRMVPTQNEYGDNITGLAKAFDTICHIEELSTRFLFQTPDFIRLSDLRWIIQLPGADDIRIGDILKINSKQFEVDGTNRWATEGAVVQKLDCHIMGTT